MHRLAATLCVCALLAVGCGDDGAAAPAGTTSSSPSPTTSTTTTTTVPPSTTVAAPTSNRPTDGCSVRDTETRTLTDESRVTPATATTEELPNRTLDTWIDRPVEPGPWPLLIFAHGLTGHPRSHEMLRTHLAGECFVVVSPAFPLTNNDVPGGFANAGDIEGQVGDISFVIDEILADVDVGTEVDPTRIGVVGHSLGGLTAAGAALAADGDVRISAAAVLSAGFGQSRDDVAVLVLHGDADPVVPVASSIGSYSLLSGRGIFVTLLGGDHTSGINDGESAYGETVRAVTSAFFALELDNDSGTVDELFELPLDVVTVEARTSSGPLDDWRAYFGR